MTYIFPGRIHTVVWTAVFISMTLGVSPLFAESTATAAQKADSIYRVDAASTASSPDGSTWAQAYKSLQAAVDAASSSGGGEVWVAAGTYTAKSDPVLTMKPSVALYGGFAGTETARTERNPDIHKTIIDGEEKRRCISGADNSELDGFVITRGFEDEDEEEDSGGGGMVNVNASPAIKNCIFIDNLSYWMGGALCNKEGSAPIITNCQFINNDSDDGGAIFNMTGSSATIVNCRFVGNTAAFGGAVYNDGNATVTITGSHFIKNSVYLNAGAVFNRNGDITIDECLFLENYAEMGGAISNFYFDGMISNSLFYKNSSETGGAVLNERSSATLANNVFWKNTALAGSGLANISSPNPVVMHCTFSHNESPDGECILSKGSSPKIVNSILWNNTPKQISHQGTEGQSEVTFSCIREGYPGAGNIDTDPRFLNAPYSFQLLPDSPCIDTGTSTATLNRDILNRPRPRDGGADMGAYEGAVAAADRYTLTLEMTPEGLGDIIPPVGSHEFAEGDTLILTALPYGAAFKEWTGDHSGSDPLVIETMNAHKTIRAVFEPNVLHVDGESTASAPDGQSWATAFQNIQDAVDVASEQGGGEIWVAGGTYTQSGDQVVLMRDGVNLYGGFSGTESLREERNWNIHLTVIDGQGRRRVVEGADNAVLDGFIIRGGDEYGTDGGGMRNFRVSPTVANCVFTKNTAERGGAMANHVSNVLVYNCIFTENNADDQGGAVFDAYSRNRYINCSFFGNEGVVGGAVANKNSSSVMINSIVWGNFPSQIDGSMDLSYSCIQGGFEGTHIITEDPMFIHAPESLALHLGSPCIDTGTAVDAPTRDYRNQPRPQGSQVDMGAYEKTPVPADSLYTLTIEATPEGPGTTNPPPGVYPCAPGDVVGIHAISHGTGFLYWRGDVTSDNKEISVVMDGNKTVTAHFKHTIHYVNPLSQATTPDGLSWESAFRNIHSAIEAAEQLGGGEVWVAAGNYTRSRVYYVLEMKEGVSLYGGFAGTETSRDERDWEANPTVIDGESQRTVVVGANNAVLDGFVITGGRSRFGAGMSNYRTSPTIINCTFIDNEAYDRSHGGAMANSLSSPVISHCHFIRNKADTFGGAIYSRYLGPVLSHCSFTDNSAANGAAMASVSASLAITHCSFSGNTTTSNGGALYNENSDGIMSYCTFTENTSNNYGGALINMNSSPLITKCVFSENQTLHGGGAILNFNASSPLIVNSVFTKNSTKTDGSGGAVMNYTDCFPKIINCSITENTAARGGGIFNFNASSPKVQNSIVWQNAPDQIANNDTNNIPVVSYSCVEGGYDGIGNIDSDPLFIDAPDNLQLAEDSPCIDAATTAGAPTRDLLGRTRPRGMAIDMGAYETIPEGEEEFPDGDDGPAVGEAFFPDDDDNGEPLEGEDVTPVEGETVTPAEGEDVEPSEGESVEPSEGESVEPSEGESVEPSEGEDVMPVEGEDVEPVEGEDVEPDDNTVEPKGCNCGNSKHLLEEGFFREQLKKNLSDWLLIGLSALALVAFGSLRSS